MSEPLQQTDQQERDLDISPEAANAWEERLRKRGLTGGEAEPSAEGEPEQQEARPPVQRQPREKREEPQNRMLPPAVGHRERKERRQALQDQASRLDKLEQSLQSLVKLLNPDLPPDPSNPEAYTADIVKKAATQALEEHPLLKEIHEERQALRQQQEEVQRENAFLGEWGDEMTGWEADYIRGNAELDGAYKQRLNAFLQASYQMHVELGDPPPLAERKAVRGLIALTDQALERGINPAAYVDHLFQRTPAVQQTVQNQGRQQQRRENRESRERREAGAAASTLSTTKAPPTASREGAMKVALEDAPQGRGRAGTLAKLARQRGNAKAAMKELRGA
jgi:hypothetical protein